MNDQRTASGAVHALGALALLSLGLSCSTEVASQAAASQEAGPPVRIVEVLGAPAAHQAVFIELRSDSSTPLSLEGWQMSVGGSWLRPITPLSLAGETPTATLEPGTLALVVDPETDREALRQAACERPVLSSESSLTQIGADDVEVLAPTIALQKRRCVPVFGFTALATMLPSATRVGLFSTTKAIDRVALTPWSAPRGHAFERMGHQPQAVTISPLGATPGTRNFHRADHDWLLGDDAPPPLRAQASSPWRVGDQIIALRREARALMEQAAATNDGSLSAQAEAFFAAADALADGQVPPNPLADAFESFVARAEDNVHGAFYQFNHPQAVDAYRHSKQRGVDVRLVSDAQFATNAHYVESFELLAAAGVSLALDVGPNGNRSALAHNKFMTRDGEALWSGSFNPIWDEPERIHADNVIEIRSPAVVAIHDQEFSTMFGGTFGTGKRGTGVGGGRVHVDGAPVTVRFSPGLTPGQLKKRAAAFRETGSAAAACEVSYSNGEPIIPERYRQLDPCGGPLDLIVGELARATSSVYFMAFSITLDEVRDVMLERLAHGGVDVKGVVDPTVSTRDFAQHLLSAGADVRYTPNSDPDCPAYVSPQSECPTNPNKVWLHHKLILIDYGTDHPVVITGSHNLSNSAEKQNDETLLVIRDRAIAEQYYRLFRETFDHPQVLGERRDTAGLPALAISEVKPTADPWQASWVELWNLDQESVSLSDLELWNRRGETIGLDGDAIEPGERRVVELPKGGRPFLDPTTALVLRHAGDGRWVATYDPYLAQQNVPVGAAVFTAGSSYSWTDLSADWLDTQYIELMGVDMTPNEVVPTWNPKGFFSDWLDEHDVTPNVLLLQGAPRGQWNAATPTPGSDTTGG